MLNSIQMTIAEFVLSVVGVAISLIGLFITISKFWLSTIQPLIIQKRDRELLNKEFSQGPFDEATIEQSTRYFIRPKCSNVDPSYEREIRKALVATREDLFEKVDYFLENTEDKRHLLILADSGMGKTTFMLNYYAYISKKIRSSHKLSLIPLGIDYADDLIKKIPDKKSTVVLLDALDEDTKAIDDHHGRIVELMSLCSKYKRVIITCRTQFFPTDEEIPVDTGIARIRPRKASEKRTYEFWKLYLTPFDDDDVDRYLKKRFSVFNVKSRKMAKKAVSQIPLLSVRPMLLAYIPDVIQSEIDVKYSFQLYEIMVDAWIERETDWVNKDALRVFSELLAVNLFANREIRGMERITTDELEQIAKEWEIDIPSWKIRGRSLLNRNASGQYKFAHRSIMEYLFVKCLLSGDKNCLDIYITDQMRQFLMEMKFAEAGFSESTLNYLSRIDFKVQLARKQNMTIMPSIKRIIGKSKLPGESSGYLNSKRVNEIFSNLTINDLEYIEEKIQNSSNNRRSYRNEVKSFISKKFKDYNSTVRYYIEKMFVDINNSKIGFEYIFCQKELMEFDSILMPDKNRENGDILKIYNWDLSDS